MRQVLGISKQGCALACFALLLCGCGGGSKGVKVEGKLLKDGQPFKAQQGELLSLSFRGKDAKGSDVICPAKVASDGTFTVAGPKGGDRVPPGNYKINLSVTLQGTDGASLAKAATINEQFSLIQGKEYEVTAEPTQTVTIDVGKGTLSK